MTQNFWSNNVTSHKLETLDQESGHGTHVHTQLGKLTSNLPKCIGLLQPSEVTKSY